MATQRQIEANRRNSEKSTGPKTRQGKENSRRNALKHGHTSQIILPEPLTNKLDNRMDDWWDEAQPATPMQEWCFRQICVASIKADDCAEEANATRDELAQRADETWENDTQLEATELFLQLPKRPEVVHRKLLQLKQGCNLLIGKWVKLLTEYEPHQGWTNENWQTALNLLGIPLEDRANILPTVFHHAAWIQEQIETLQTYRAELLEVQDARRRANARAGKFTNFEPKRLRELRRYHTAAMRDYKWFIGHLKELQNAPALASPPSVPDFAPASTPEPPTQPTPEPSIIDAPMIVLQAPEVLPISATAPAEESEPAEEPEAPAKRPPAPANLSGRARKEKARRARVQAKAEAQAQKQQAKADRKAQQLVEA